MGAAGDMLLAALYELDPDRKAALAALNGLGIPHVRYFVDPSEKCGILGTHMTVTVYDEEEESWDSSCMEQVVHDEPTAQAVHFHGDSGGHHAADGHAMSNTDLTRTRGSTITPIRTTGRTRTPMNSADLTRTRGGTITPIRTTGRTRTPMSMAITITPAWLKSSR